MNFLGFSFYIVGVYEGYLFCNKFFEVDIAITKWFILFHFDLDKNMWIDDLLHFKWKYKIDCHLFYKCVSDYIMLWFHMSLSMKPNIIDIYVSNFIIDMNFGLFHVCSLSYICQAEDCFIVNYFVFNHFIFFICVNNLK